MNDLEQSIQDCVWENGNSLQICESSDDDFSRNVCRERIEANIAFSARSRG
jgi:hypothetical protein